MLAKSECNKLSRFLCVSCNVKVIIKKNYISSSSVRESDPLKVKEIIF